MTDKKYTLEELRFLIDGFIQEHISGAQIDDCIPDEIYLAKLTQIRDSLQPVDNEELVEKVLNIGSTFGASLDCVRRGHGIKEKARAEIRTLLPPRQPVVTTEEIDELCETLETIINQEDPTDMDRYMKQYIQDWLKSKGVKVEER